MAFSQVIQVARKATTQSVALARSARHASAQSASVFLRDVGQGLLEVSHNTLALMGMVLSAVLIFAASHADLRHEAEAWALGWLQARHEARAEPADALAAELSEPDAIARASWRNGCRTATAWRRSRSAGWCRKPGASARRPGSTRR
jgi:hypothetical protein